MFLNLSPFLPEALKKQYSDAVKLARPIKNESRSTVDNTYGKSSASDVKS